jgi:hypothetical protein
MLSRGEASLVREAEILRFACGLAQDDIHVESYFLTSPNYQLWQLSLAE